MKKFISTSATILFIVITSFAQEGTNNNKWYASVSPSPGFPQDLRFEVRGKYLRPVKKEKLGEAKFIGDFISGYPKNWLSDYISVEILTTCNGKAMKAMSSNDVLSIEQKNILNAADYSTDIVININYRSKNAGTDKIENREMNILVAIIPELEAKYVGGYEQLAKYLRKNVINKISETTSKEFQHGVVGFTVNDQGDTVNAKVVETSGDLKTDKLLVDAINKMPKWKPAENSKGIKVKQEFEFSVGNSGC
jgi:TonB family protein